MVKELITAELTILAIFIAKLTHAPPYMASTAFHHFLK